MSKLKIAFIKYAGLSAGGTEKFLQTIAANLDKGRFEVDYYYTDAVKFEGSENRQAGTNQDRLEYMKRHGINLIEIKLDSVDLTKKTYPWIRTNLFEKFDEKRYDLIQTGRAGHPEYPFTKIRHTPIVDSLHLLAGVDNQYNISRVMHITNWSRKIWEFKGGDKNRSVLVSHPIEIQNVEYQSMREALGLNGKVILGFHQRNNDSIFSPIQLEAYKKVETKNTHFIILGGSALYQEQAKKLNVKNITFLEHSADPSKIYSFLKTLDIYAHGRKDGEVNSTAMAEAFYFGLPIISHVSEINNGHIECIGNAGYVAKDVNDYASELKKIIGDYKYREEKSKNALQRFDKLYELKKQIKNIEKIYEDVVKNPFPNKISRFISTFKLRRIFIYFPIKALKLGLKYLKSK